MDRRSRTLWDDIRGREIHCKTSDGLFNEQFSAAASTSSGETRVEWQGTVLAPAIMGTFLPSYSPTEQVIFEGQFDGATTSGLVDELVPDKISGPGGQW
jgi:hypothetical protein